MTKLPVSASQQCAIRSFSLRGAFAVTYISAFTPTTAAINYKPTVCPPAMDSLIACGWLCWPHCHDNRSK